MNYFWHSIIILFTIILAVKIVDSYQLTKNEMTAVGYLLAVEREAHALSTDRHTKTQQPAIPESPNVYAVLEELPAYFMMQDFRNQRNLFPPQATDTNIVISENTIDTYAELNEKTLRFAEQANAQLTKKISENAAINYLEVAVLTIMIATAFCIIISSNNRKLKGEMVQLQKANLESTSRTDTSQKVLMNILSDLEKERISAEEEARYRQIVATALERRNDEMEQFIYAISHDLRAPLITINGFTRMLLDSLSNKLNADEKRLFDRIIINTATMESLLADLLQLSRVIETELEKQTLNASDVIQKVEDALTQQLDDHAVTLEKNIITPTLWANGSLIIQALINLITNAIKYQKDDTPPLIKLTFMEENGQSIIRVSDNGIGIAPEYHKKIFSVFERIGDKDVDGNGVGLSIVDSIAKKHSGHITVQSALGTGSIFSIHLPLQVNDNGEKNVA